MTALIAALTFSGAVRADEPAVPIERFMQLDAHLYRGAQPDEAGFRYLQAHGIDTVISLRNDASEQALVESLGMRWVQIPITFRPFGWGDDFSADHVREFFAALDDPANGTIFSSTGRRGPTGTLAAIYRMTRQDWN
ncbi:MAG: hypothetical protein R2712_30345 [Vicinamibacterales bacterium]